MEHALSFAKDALSLIYPYGVGRVLGAFSTGRGGRIRFRALIARWKYAELRRSNAGPSAVHRRLSRRLSAQVLGPDDRPAKSGNWPLSIIFYMATPGFGLALQSGLREGAVLAKATKIAGRTPGQALAFGALR